MTEPLATCAWCSDGPSWRVCGPCLDSEDDADDSVVDLAQRLSRTLDVMRDTETHINDERRVHERLADHYERAGLRGLASYYRSQVELSPLAH